MTPDGRLSGEWHLLCFCRLSLDIASGGSIKVIPADGGREAANLTKLLEDYIVKQATNKDTKQERRMR